MSAEQERAWQDWRDLALRAAETKTVDDCIASGKAFARFHYLFVEVDFRPSTDKIAPFARQSNLGGAA
ncbi:hypothetical protein [Mesorhizobium sp. M0895]|uniref:hypothetical protein n=1 Tax=Mesorhizobium sp. M0895 TaxID=2957019 RepID=UPI0033358617